MRGAGGRQALRVGRVPLLGEVFLAEALLAGAFLDACFGVLFFGGAVEPRTTSSGMKHSFGGSATASPFSRCRSAIRCSAAWRPISRVDWRAVVSAGQACL